MRLAGGPSFVFSFTSLGPFEKPFAVLNSFRMLADVIPSPNSGQLEQCIDQWYAPFMTAYDFHPVDKHHEDACTCYTYQNQFFRLKLCYDGQCLSSALAPLHTPCRYFDTALLQVLVKLADAPELTSWHLRNELTRPLSCTEQAEALQNNYHRLISMLRTARYAQTLARLEELDHRRGEALFWNKVRQLAH